VSDTDPEERLTVSIVLRKEHSRPGLDQGFDQEVSGVDAVGLRRAMRRQAAEANSASPVDVRAVAEFATRHGLEVVDVGARTRVVRVAGTVGQMNAAFGTSLGIYAGRDRQDAYRGREGEIHLPAEVLPSVTAVLGLDNRKQLFPRNRTRPVREDEGHFRPRAPGSSDGPAWPVDFARFYRFPLSSRGEGQTVAVIQLDAGIDWDDLARSSRRQQLPMPVIGEVMVDGATGKPDYNRRDDEDDPDQEAAIDVQVLHAAAPGARIVVYYGPNSTAGFYDTLSAAVHDIYFMPSIISISYGAPEGSWTSASMELFDGLFQDAERLGVTVFAASGDDGARDNWGSGGVHVDFPASSPHVVACGGTELTRMRGSVTSETVWNDVRGSSGGGVSTHFPLPPWQEGAGVPPSKKDGRTIGRGVPDVAAHAGVDDGHLYYCKGQLRAAGGTSVVAPFYAGLFARLDSLYGGPRYSPLPMLYAYRDVAERRPFRDVVEGDNSRPTDNLVPAVAGYQAKQGWDACSGLGSMDGNLLLTWLVPRNVSLARNVAAAAANVFVNTRAWISMLTSDQAGGLHVNKRVGGDLVGPGGRWFRGPGDRFFHADVDADGIDETVIHNVNRWMCVAKLRYGQVEAEWMGNSVGGAGGGWTRTPGDRFGAGDVDGDGAAEVLVRDLNGQLALLHWRPLALASGGRLDVMWRGTQVSGPAGLWLLRGDDDLEARDIDGDGKAELVVGSRAAWTGVASWTGRSLTLDLLTDAFVGPAGIWARDPRDVFTYADLDGDGAQEILVSGAGRERAVCKWVDGRLELLWKGDVLAGEALWQLSDEDHWLAGDLDGDGADEILLVNRNGWIGVVEWQTTGELTGRPSLRWLGRRVIGAGLEWVRGAGDHFFIGDVDGDGRAEIVVENPNGWLGVLVWHNQVLSARWLRNVRDMDGGI
jgi:kumamolisin